MSLKQIRLSAQAREQLIRLRTRTGIGQWNILCRWAFCLSLRQPTPPTPLDVPADSNVELTWQVFGGEAQELYFALLTERCARDGLGTPEEALGPAVSLAPAPRHQLPGRSAPDPDHRGPSPSGP
jgi:DNA sulfur modification protein DndE